MSAISEGEGWVIKSSPRVLFRFQPSHLERFESDALISRFLAQQQPYFPFFPSLGALIGCVWNTRAIVGWLYLTMLVANKGKPRSFYWNNQRAFITRYLISRPTCARPGGQKEKKTSEPRRWFPDILSAIRNALATLWPDIMFSFIPVNCRFARAHPLCKYLRKMPLRK